MSGSSTTTTTTSAEPPAAVAGGATAAKPAASRIPIFSAEAWSPLKVELFRSLYIATSIAQIGTWAREAASPSLMTMLTDGWRNQPDMVGRITLYSNLPICLFSLIAGGLADVLDRRRLLIWTNLWMIVVSVVLGLLTLRGQVSPWGLLGLTFLLGLGTAATGPALQAVLPELVPPKDMALAINLNSVALNVARAVGPAAFILVVWAVPGKLAGIGVSFFLSALTFAGAAWVLYRWKRQPQRAAVHGEDLFGAIRSGFRYTIHSPANRAILLRVACFIVPAVALWSQVPMIAKDQLGMPKTPASYALLFAFVGTGAIFGVLIMPGLQKRYKIDPVVNACIALFALGMVALSFTHRLWLAAPLLLFLGVNWVIIPTNFNTATQKSVPPWVKGRAISFYLTVLFGSFTLAGFIWGKVTTASSIHTTLLVAGASMAALLVLARWFPLTLNEGLDLAPAFKPGTAPAHVPGGTHAAAVVAETRATPDIPPPVDPIAGAVNPVSPTGTNGNGAAPATATAATTPTLDYRTANVAPPPDAALPAPGPVEVTIDYEVEPARAAEFLAVMHQVAAQRKRGGATHWRLSRRAPDAGGGRTLRYAETFRFHSRAELVRQPGRMTKADLALFERAWSFHAGGGYPAVRQSPVTDAAGAAPAAWWHGWADHVVMRTLEEVETIARRASGERVKP